MSGRTKRKRACMLCAPQRDFGTMDSEHTRPEEDPHSNPASPVERLPLRHLGLRAGMALQTRRLVEGTSKKESQYIGAIEGKGVMVGPMSAEAEQTGLSEGEVCVVRGFTGRHEFSFLSKVLQTFQKPFVYALLSYPTLVDTRLVRNSMRIKTCWSAHVAVAHRLEQVHAATVVDCSTAGAMVTLLQPIAPVGELLRLTLPWEMEAHKRTLQLHARICHSHRLSGDALYCVGMAFTPLEEQERLMLAYLVQNAS